MKSEKQTVAAIEKYADMVKRICFMYLKDEYDTEDIFQGVFLKYFQSEIEFTDEEHEKAWLIRVSINSCKDLVKSFSRRQVTSLDDVSEIPSEVSEDNHEIWEGVLSLKKEYKDVVYLHYYEGYKAHEIGEILGIKENTVYTWLARARKELKEKLGGEVLE